MARRRYLEDFQADVYDFLLYRGLPATEASRLCRDPLVTEVFRRSGSRQEASNIVVKDALKKLKKRDRVLVTPYDVAAGTRGRASKKRPCGCQGG